MRSSAVCRAAKEPRAHRGVTLSAITLALLASAGCGGLGAGRWWSPGAPTPVVDEAGEASQATDAAPPIEGASRYALLPLALARDVIGLPLHLAGVAGKGYRRRGRKPAEDVKKMSSGSATYILFGIIMKYGYAWNFTGLKELDFLFSVANVNEAVVLSLVGAAAVWTSPYWGRWSEHVDGWLIRTGTTGGYESAFDPDASWMPNVCTLFP